MVYEKTARTVNANGKKQAETNFHPLYGKKVGNCRGGTTHSDFGMG
jgi:hypothetical protein